MNIKTDWKNGDYFTFADYNRIMSNAVEICNALGRVPPTYTTKTVNDVCYVNDLNILVNWVNSIANFVWESGKIPKNYYYGRVFVSNSRCWSFDEINGIESDFRLMRKALFRASKRITESGKGRITENNDKRILEN